MGAAPPREDADRDGDIRARRRGPDQSLGPRKIVDATGLSAKGQEAIWSGVSDTLKIFNSLVLMVLTKWVTTIAHKS